MFSAFEMALFRNEQSYLRNRARVVHSSGRPGEQETEEDQLPSDVNTVTGTFSPN